MSQTLPPNHPLKKLLPWIVAVSLFMETMDATILNTAVPSIAKALSVDPLSMKAVLASYTLSLALFIPISGWMADRFGSRKVFGTAIGVFTIGSLFCGISMNVPMLVVSRIFQGFGGAMMTPVGRLVMVRSFAKNELVQSLGFVAIPALIGPMLGPVIGGAIVSYFHWSVIFFVNIPIGLMGLYLVGRYLPDYSENGATPPDLKGLFLFGAGITLLSYVLEVFGEHTHNAQDLLCMLVISVLFLVWYCLHATKAKFPLLRLDFFKIRTFRASVIGGFVTRVGLGGVPFLLPLLYQVCMGYSAIQSGFLMVPQAIGAISMRFFAARVLTLFGYRGILISNTIIMGLLIILFGTIGPHTPVLWIAALGLLFGVFSSMQYSSMNSLVYADVGAKGTNNANTIFSTFQQLSISFGIASSALVTAFFMAGGMKAITPRTINGLHEAFIAMGVLTIFSTMSFGELRGNDGASVSRHFEPKLDYTKPIPRAAKSL